MDNFDKRIMIIRQLVRGLCILVLCCSVFTRLVLAGDAEVVDRIIAIVSDEIITLSELNEIYQPQVDRIKSMGYPLREERKRLFKLREEMLWSLIYQKLADQEIKEKKLKVSDAELNKTIERFKEDKLLSDGELRTYLGEQGVTEEEFRNNLRKSILKDKLLSYEVRSKIVITQEDIKTYYDSHISAYGAEKEYHLRNIAMSVPASADEKTRQAVFSEMEKISKALNEGQSLNSVADKYSNTPYSLIGGDLGTFKLNELSPKLQEAVADKKAGEYTSVMEADFGYQLLFVQEIIEVEGKSLEKASADIREKLNNEKLDEKYREWLENLKEKSHIKIIK